MLRITQRYRDMKPLRTIVGNRPALPFLTGKVQIYNVINDLKVTVIDVMNEINGTGLADELVVDYMEDAVILAGPVPYLMRADADDIVDRQCQLKLIYPYLVLIVYLQGLS